MCEISDASVMVDIRNIPAEYNYKISLGKRIDLC